MIHIAFLVVSSSTPRSDIYNLIVCNKASPLCTYIKRFTYKHLIIFITVSQPTKSDILAYYSFLQPFPYRLKEISCRPLFFFIDEILSIVSFQIFQEKALEYPDSREHHYTSNFKILLYIGHNLNNIFSSNIVISIFWYGTISGPKLPKSVHSVCNIITVWNEQGPPGLSYLFSDKFFHNPPTTQISVCSFSSGRSLRAHL